MKTNYYLRTSSRWLPFHLKEKVYLGQSIDGWTFALRVIPECGIRDLGDMISWLGSKIHDNKSVIVNNKGTRLYLLEFLQVVTRRSCPHVIRYGWNNDWWLNHPAAQKGVTYASEEAFHQVNRSERGPSGLLRRKIDGRFCIGHGNGTWDLCVGSRD